MTRVLLVSEEEMDTATGGPTKLVRKIGGPPVDDVVSKAEALFIAAKKYRP